MSLREDYHVTDPGYQASEHCPRCGTWAQRLDDSAQGTVRWRCRNCEYRFLRYRDAGAGSVHQLTTDPDGSGAGPPTCQNCGNVVSRGYWRVFSNDDGALESCARCESRTGRYGTDDVLGDGQQLDCRNERADAGDRDADTGPFGDAGASVAPTQYGGEASCRWCQERLDMAAKTTTHLLEAHPDRVRDVLGE